VKVTMLRRIMGKNGEKIIVGILWIYTEFRQRISLLFDRISGARGG
jgi:hypothetical protein